MKRKYKERKITRSVEEHKTTTLKMRRAKQWLKARMLDEDNEPDLRRLADKQVPMRVWRWKSKWLTRTEQRVLAAAARRDPENYHGFVVRRSALMKNKAIYKQVALYMLRHKYYISYEPSYSSTEKERRKAERAKFDSCIKVPSNTEFCVKIQEAWYKFWLAPSEKDSHHWWKLEELPYFKNVGSYLGSFRTTDAKIPVWNRYVPAFTFSSRLCVLFYKAQQDPSLACYSKQMSKKEISKLG